MGYRRILNVFAYDLRVGDVVLNETSDEVTIIEKHLDNSDGDIHLGFDRNIDGVEGLYCIPVTMFKLVYRPGPTE